MSASVGRPETTSPIIHGSTIEGTVSWTPFPLALNGPESAYRTILQKLPRNPYGPGGTVMLNPDEEVQARLRLVFAKFRELKSAKAVMRYLRRGGLALPVRPLVGPAPHELVWRSANSPRVLSILKNPAYAGVYVYGRRRVPAAHPIPIGAARSGR